MDINLPRKNGIQCVGELKELATGAAARFHSRGPPGRLAHVEPDRPQVVAYFQKPRGQPLAEAQLSERKREVLECLAKGLLYKQIAAKMGISMATVRTYTQRIYEKLHVHTRTEAVVKYLQH